MFRNNWKTLSLGSMAALAIGAAASSLPARAEVTLQTTGTPVSCTTTNCKSLRVFGAINASFGNANAWIGQFKVDSGSCMRFDVTGATSDLEMTVIQPNGTFYRNDDTTGTKPRVIIAAPSTGVYTVVVYQYAGTAISEAFSMAVKNYVLGNPNCANPTTGMRPAHARKAASAAPAAKNQTDR